MPSSLLNILAESYPSDPNAVWRGAEGYQNAIGRSMELQQKREAMEAERGLRALYAQNPNPSFEEVARLSPAFAMQQQNAMMEMQQKQLGMQKTRSEIGQMDMNQMRQESEVFANALGPVAEQFLMQVGDQGTPEQQEQFKRMIGAQIQGIEAQYGLKPRNLEAIYNATPSQLLQMAVSNKYKSPFMENQMALQREQMMRGLPPAMTPQQAYGGVEKTPYGFMRVPGIGGQPMTPGPQYGVTPFNPNAGQMQQGPVPGGMQQAPIGAEDLGILKQNRAQMQPGPERDALDRMIAEVETGRVAQPPAGGFITPQQEMQMRLEEERQKKELETAAAGQKKGAELAAETAEETAKKASTMAVLPPDEEVYDLIKKSLSGNIEKSIKETAASEQLGIGTAANTATAELTSIQEQLRSVVKALYTPGAITKDEQEKMETAIGAIAKAKDPQSRIAGYRRFMDMARKSIVNHPELASEVEKITGNKILSPRRKLEIGHRVGNQEYIGGNPNSPNSWKEIR